MSICGIEVFTNGKNVVEIEMLFNVCRKRFERFLEYIVIDNAGVFSELL